MLLVLEGLFMSLATLCAVYYHVKNGEQDWKALAVSSVITLAVGFLTWRRFRVTDSYKRKMTRNDSFVIVAFTWVIYTAFGMVPYMIYEGLGLSPINACFETMSGFTTFGVTLIPDLDHQPHGLMLWRSLTQWMGGLGIVVFSIALIPAGDMRNSNIFMAEASAISMDRLRPRMAATARRLLSVYLLFTLTCSLLYWLGPMNWFDAVCHGLTTVSTGGFSNYAAGLGHFRSAYVEYVAVVFMLLSAINFTVYYYLSVRQLRMMRKNEEMRYFLLFFVVFALLFVAMFCFGGFSSGEDVPIRLCDRLRAAIFHVASTISTCSNTGQWCNYVSWGTPFVFATILMKLIGGCTYSTAGGLKVARVIVFIRLVVNEFLLYLHPRAIVSVRINGHVLGDTLVRRSVAFMLLYMTMVFVGIFIFSLMGYDLASATDLVVSSLSNVGPDIDYFGMPTMLKALLCFYMLAGRLEIFTILFLFMPDAWKR